MGKIYQYRTFLCFQKRQCRLDNLLLKIGITRQPQGTAQDKRYPKGPGGLDGLCMFSDQADLCSGDAPGFQIM